MSETPITEGGVDFAFSPENLEAAKAILAKYPEGREASATMPLLTLAQRQNDNWLPREAMDVVADMVGLAPIRVYEVATFYTMYNLKPVGKNFVQVCTNISCLIKGSDDVFKACKKKLGVGNGETTEDGAFTLLEVECLGACVNAPMMQINDDYYEDLTGETTEKVLDALAKGEQPTTGVQSGLRVGCQPAGGLTTLTGEE
ncbi:NADH-quinone oxidoreductase subunit NuoE [Magnetovibrio sp. PR-2]|uniref:NADH-quinone oxidoreductase subunit NuoE n=1 Tax=Magnetovibrio sp. PR-2 TaxID=3120356 RepID=UPI002FCE2094